MKQLPDPLPGQSAAEYLLASMRLYLSDPQFNGQTPDPAPLVQSGCKKDKDKADFP